MSLRDPTRWVLVASEEGVAGEPGRRWGRVNGEPEESRPLPEIRQIEVRSAFSGARLGAARVLRGRRPPDGRGLRARACVSE